MELITILCILAVLIAIQGFRVDMYRKKFVIRIAQKAVKSEDTVELIKKAFDELDRVPYQMMIWKFWIPLNKFFNEDNIFVEDAK